MVSTFSPNIQLEEPARGDQVGTWDTPVNNNMTLLDLVTGGSVTIGLNNSPVVLAAAQFQSKTIVFNSTLTGSVAITFPSSFTKSYEIYNTCTGSSAFIVTLQTTVAGSRAVCAPPGEFVEIANVGGNLFYKNLGRIGTYWDYAGSSVPAWVSGCTVPPYLNCTGGTFSSATYPQLAVILGSTTLPDSAGRARYTLNQGTGRLTSAGAGIDGNTIFAAGGNDGVMLSSAEIPTHSVGPTANNITLSPIGFNIPKANSAISQQPSPSTGGNNVPTTPGSWSALTSSDPFNPVNITTTYTNASQNKVEATAPGYVGGITMIRAG
jgi:microcystin-dependent protein